VESKNNKYGNTLLPSKTAVAICCAVTFRQSRTTPLCVTSSISDNPNWRLRKQMLHKQQLHLSRRSGRIHKSKSTSAAR
ncbi:MAG: hypothetical protein KDA78_03310, partial [Planctomycetaceae bacterium]|nr:hypothetical protein [Planctomycetaceae bacterium]